MVFNQAYDADAQGLKEPESLNRALIEPSESQVSLKRVFNQADDAEAQGLNVTAILKQEPTYADVC